MTFQSYHSVFGQPTALPLSSPEPCTIDHGREEREARNRQHAMTIRRSLAARADRRRFFRSSLFADPAWDLLLELYAATLLQRRMTISRLVGRSGVPMTTALRWIATLEQEGLVERQPDRFDRRRIFLSLSANGRSAMESFLDTVEAESTLF